MDFKSRAILRVAAANSRTRAQALKCLRCADYAATPDDVVRAAADRGECWARAELGARLADRWDDEALVWLDAAAQQGDAYAMYNLALSYAVGLGGGFKLASCTKWLDCAEAAFEQPLRELRAGKRPPRALRQVASCEPG